MKLKRFLVTALLLLCAVTMVGCGKKTELTETQKIIAEAETMSLHDLCVKAIAESKGKTFYGLGNSSRGKTALPLFIAYLQTIDSTYTLDPQWQQPKNNKIFDQLSADSTKAQGTYAMTLIQDGNQIESKMVKTGILDTFIPKDWAEANGTTPDKYEGYLSLQLLNKVFMFNNTGDKVYDNCWDFVAEGEHGLYMDIDSELVGKNFLYTLTQEQYANDLKDAYDKITDATQKAYIDKAVSSVAEDATNFKLSANGKYALAWIKLWVESYNTQTDDGPICNTLTAASATNQFGLLVYSKLRSVKETETTSVNNITVAAYQQGEDIYNKVKYEGIGGYAYCHYLFVTENSPLPWTACAFIAYMTCINKEATDVKNDGSVVDDQVAGFSAWGKDMGGYSSNPALYALSETYYKHNVAGYVDNVNTYDCKNDRGLTWWTTTGKLVVEDPAYCSNVAFTVGSWIETLTKYVA